MLCRRNLAMRAPVAVVYDGGGVYLGGGSSVAALAVEFGGVALTLLDTTASWTAKSVMCSPIGGRYKSWILYKTKKLE